MMARAHGLGTPRKLPAKHASELENPPDQTGEQFHTRFAPNTYDMSSRVEAVARCSTCYTLSRLLHMTTMALVDTSA